MDKFIEFLTLCGCTEEETIREDTLKLLLYFNSENKNLDKIIKEVGKTTFYLLSNKMDDFDLINHGSSIRFAWLTEKGKEILTKENLKEDVSSK